MERSRSLLIFEVIDQRSMSILDLEYFYIEQQLTGLNQNGYTVRIWKCQEPINFQGHRSKVKVKMDCDNIVNALH